MTPKFNTSSWWALETTWCRICAGTLRREGERPSADARSAKLELEAPQRRRLRDRVKRGAGAAQCLPR